MKKLSRRSTAALAIAALATGAAAWGGSSLLEGAEPAALPAQIGSGPTGRSLLLAQTRLSCRIEDLDRFVAEQQRLLAEDPTDPERWRVLAEAYLERHLMRDQHRGMQVGQALHDELPEANRADLEAGLAAVGEARGLGDPSGDLCRIEAGLLTGQITGWGSALRLNGQLDAAIGRAHELGPDDPRALVALGCRKLFAPKLLGHDPEDARRLLLAAADGLVLDERPLVFAAMATWLLDRAAEAEELLRRAIERNPKNVYAAEVARRLAAGEAEPFARDVR